MYRRTTSLWWRLSYMTWGGVSFHARTELVFIQNGTLNSNRYPTVILEDHVPFMGFVGEEATFMHDNARPHTARLVSAYLDEVHITRFVYKRLSLPEEGILATEAPKISLVST
nr:unnamed protein product [Callosobruchus analis]